MERKPYPTDLTDEQWSLIGEGEEKGDADIFAAARAEAVLQTALEKWSAPPLGFSLGFKTIV
jgi:hypothetical protein